MKEISRTEFFATVGSLNVHPRPDISTFNGRYFASEWELLDNSRRIVGRSVSDSWGVGPTKFYCAEPASYPRNLIAP